MMKTMRRLTFITAICALLAAPVWADQVTTVDGYGIWQAGQGGEFTLKPSASLSWVLPYYSASTRNQGSQVVPGSFQTFCLEQAEYVYANTTFDVVLNDKAVLGGVAFPGDPLSVGTAWLYHEWQQGTLAGYDYADTGVGRHESAVALQNTIWWLEGGADPGANVFKTAVLNEFITEAKATADNAGQYAVAVLNLWVPGHINDFSKDTSGNYLYLRQDMLVCVPIPAAVLLGMLGLGAAGLKLRKFV